MKKKILYYVPFALHLMFYLFIIFTNGITNLHLLEILLLLGGLFICGLSFSNDNKISQIVGPITLFITSFALIVTGIENTNSPLFETKIAIAIIIYFLLLLLFKKRKTHSITTSIVIFLLLVLFVPAKFEYKDGGTVEYKSLSYKYIKWHRIRNNSSYYEATDIYWFPKNIYSLDYYAPIDLPIVFVSNEAQGIKCNIASYNWTETVDKKEKWESGLSIDPVQMNYDDSLIINENKEVTINTEYTVTDVKYTEYKEKYKGNDFAPTYQVLDYDKEEKNISLENLKEGTYIFKIEIKGEKSSTATYSFKVEVAS